MPVILVAGTEPGAGATTVAAGLGHRLAYAGHRVRLARLSGDERAEADARALALTEFADSTGTPLEARAVAGAEGVTIVEAPAGADARALARDLGATLVAVGPVSGSLAGADLYIGNHARTSGELQIGEDRTLAAPTVRRLIEASRARVLARSEEGDDAVCDHIVVGPISHDPNEPFFRKFPRACIVTRAEKVDIVLAALRTNPACVILTGGGEPSPYIIDFVLASRSTTLLLAPEGTVETMRDIEGTFGSVPFSHEAKVERIGELMRGVIDDETVESLVGVAPASR